MRDADAGRAGVTPGPAQFAPLRPVNRRQRALAYALGPLTWLAALLVLAFVLDRRDAVEAALLVLAVSFTLALIVLAWMRRARVREERERP